MLSMYLWMAAVIQNIYNIQFVCDVSKTVLTFPSLKTSSYYYEIKYFSQIAS